MPAYHPPPSYATGLARSPAESAAPWAWDKLEGLWCPSLGESGSRLFDSSRYGNHGDLVNMAIATCWPVSDQQQCLQFDGSDDYVNCGDVCKVGLDNFSFGCWFNTSSTANGGIMGKTVATGATGRYALYVDAGNLSLLQGGGLAATMSMTTLADGRWHLAVGTYDRAGNMTLYIDGIVSASGSLTPYAGVNWDTSFPLYFGAYPDAAGTGPLSGYRWPGQWDCGFFYRRCLSQPEAVALYDGGAGRGIWHRPAIESRFWFHNYAYAALTQGADSLTATGTVALAASASLTQGAQSTTAAAEVALAATASLTQGAQTLSATAAVALDAAASLSQADQTLSSAATVALAAAGSLTQADQTGAAAATVAIEAAASPTQGDQTAAGAATVAIDASAAPTQGTDTLTAAAAVALAASGSLSQGTQSTTASAEVALAATGTLSQADQSLTGSAAMAVAASASLTQGAQSTTAAAEVALAATASLTQGAQTLHAMLGTHGVRRLTRSRVFHSSIFRV